jgi:hypothetical protein
LVLGEALCRKGYRVCGGVLGGVLESVLEGRDIEWNQV